MFENYRSTEYGWESGPLFRDSIMRSQIFRLIEGLTRANVHENWKAETRRLLRDVAPGSRLGTPMDHAAEAMIHWRKFLAVYRSVMPKLFPLGIHSRAPLLEQKEGKLTDAEIWHPKFNYDTYVANVSEHRATQEKMNEILAMLQKETDDGKFTSASDELKLTIIEELEKYQRPHGLYLVNQFAWLPRSREPEQIEAQDYGEACQHYQASIAGRRAKRLLLENLTEAQERDYWRHGYFFVMPRDQDCPLHERRLYVIERSFPNGNVLRVKQKRAKSGKWHWYPEHTYCFHTQEPHAVDDIILSQKLLLESEESEFLKEAHATEPILEGRVPLIQAKRSV